MRKEMLAVGVALTLVATAFGASAFTSATVSNDASMNVVSDDDALIGLTDNTSGDVIDQEASGSLQIDFDAMAAKGFNNNATVTFGDGVANDPENNAGASAFTIVNNANSAQDLDISYDGSDNNSVENVQFKLARYESGSSSAITKTLSEEDSDDTVTFSGVPADDVVYVDLVVDTTGAGVTDSTTYNGTITVSATPAA